MPGTFHRGVFTLSFDFELVWGSRDLVRSVPALCDEARVTRAEVFGPLLDALTRLGIQATWATVGHLFLGEARRVDGVLHPDIVPPRHSWFLEPWFDGVPEGTEAEHPEYYGESLVRRLVAAGQEVGSHSFSHPVFGDPGCTRQVADTELARCVAEAERLGVQLRSFVFPRNVSGHLDLLARHGFTVWRDVEPAWFHHPNMPHQVGRLGHLASVAGAFTPPTVLPIRSEHGLWNLPASASFLPYGGVRRAIPIARRVARCEAGLDAAARSRRVFHLYLHPINLASAPRPMLAGLISVLESAARRRDAGELEILGMAAVAERARKAAVAA
ncbi:MAG: polysaccharide deacetylase family protein [Alphaproteobacteria bacterium]|nr:polysaccharide deacetylase family protein [Alphaproteobacteria bacterium]